MDEISTEIADGLARMFAARAEQRQAEIELTWSALSRREQRLVREAAVMGYVQGVRDGQPSSGVDFPHDADILYKVIGACLASLVWDLYPQINRVHRLAARRRDNAGAVTTRG